VHSFAGGFFGILTHPIPLISLAVALLGIFTAYAMYKARWISPDAVGRTFKPLYTLFIRKYWMDELYENVIVRAILFKGIFRVLDLFDSGVVDGAVNGLARGTSTASRAVRQLQTGQLQVYAMTIAIGIVAIILCIYIFG
jgi:NADH-quinone oxidoreductase subunit L